jgi:hypothetical protein
LTGALRPTPKKFSNRENLAKARDMIEWMLLVWKMQTADPTPPKMPRTYSTQELCQTDADQDLSVGAMAACVMVVTDSRLAPPGEIDQLEFDPLHFDDDDDD